MTIMQNADLTAKSDETEITLQKVSIVIHRGTTCLALIASIAAISPQKNWVKLVIEYG